MCAHEVGWGRVRGMYAIPVLRGRGGGVHDGVRARIGTGRSVAGLGESNAVEFWGGVYICVGVELVSMSVAVSVLCWVWVLWVLAVGDDAAVF